MDQTTIWASIFILVTIVALRLRTTIAMNRGVMIRNIAIWVGIVLALAFFYHLFGPFDMATNSLPANQHTSSNVGIQEGGRPNLESDSDPILNNNAPAQKKNERDL
jgi:hypothetical protein